MGYAHHAGCKLRYRVDDCRQPWLRDGRSIVFHHGVGASAELWGGWLPALIERYRLVRFDMRGHGGSAPVEGHTWTLTAMIGDLAAVIDATCADEAVHLVGESIGGTVALAYAMTYPERVKTLTVSNGAYLGGSIRNLHDWSARMGTGGMAAWSKMMMERRFYPGAISRAARDWFEAEQARADSRSILDAVGVLVGTDLSADFDRVTMPVLLLHPDASPFIPVSVMATMCEQLADARLAVFAHARHGLPFSHADQCARTVAQFLAENG